MDLRGLCSKIDLDSIRAKFPHMPAMPPIKLPKSMPKLKSRKIFRSSREDVNKATPKQAPRPTSLSLQPPMPQPAEFINHTPTRISTISSLMQQHTTESTRRSSGAKCLENDESFERNDINTYRSAHRVDDDYPSPVTLHNTLYDESPPIRSSAKRSGGGGAAKTNSPQVTDSKTCVKMTFGEKLQKSYKDLTEFRFKNLLSKKTVVRSDNIVLDYYVQRYDEERQAEEREQKLRDREIADNYRFKFKETRQSSTRSYSMSPFDSPITQRIKSHQSLQRLSGKAARTVSEQSGDESGMEITPPRRASRQSRFPRGRSADSMSDDNELEQEVPIQVPISSSLWAIKEKQIEMERSQSQISLKKGHKERIRRLTSYISSHNESGAESANDAAVVPKKQSKLQKISRHRHVDEEPNATENPEDSLDKEQTANKPLDAFKKNLMRFKSTMSIKRPAPTEGDNDAANEQKIERSATSPTLTKGEKLTARLRRFKTREVASIDDDESSPTKQKKHEPNNSGSPLRAAIANKLQTWKMSFKKKPDESVNTGDETSPEKRHTRTSTLKEKLKYIRSRKNANSNDEQEAGDNEGTTTDTDQKKSTSNLEEKFTKARQRTLKRVNDKMQKIKFFHKSQDSPSDKGDVDESGKTAAISKTEPMVVFKRRAISHDGDDEYGHSSESEIEEIPHRHDDSYSYASTKKVHAVWTTKPILSDSTESEDNDVEYPRVVIHQEESDLFESTLIIAVTTAAAVPATPPSPTPKITEITTKTPPKSTPTRPKALDWKTKKDSGGFSESLSPNDENGRTEWIRGHARKLSMDSNSDSDSWITDTIRNKQLSTVNKEEIRRTSAIALNSIDENEEPWRVHSMYPEEKIYRAQSIDIFAENIKQGAFEDFDDQLKDQPVLKIVRKSNSDASLGKDSSDDADDTADDDNSSRITKVRVKNTCEETQVIAREDILLIRRSKSPEEPVLVEERQSWQIGNSRESLDANFDENEEYSEDDDDYDDDDDDRPPSTAPSPPPMSPPPPPLPQRQPSVRLSNSVAVPLEEILLPPLPPLPATRPPTVINKLPPQIPERNESMTRIAKPLVKTSSLRLAYSEQVKPADIGKVNKLISKFEQPGSFEQQESQLAVRRRVRQKALMSNASEDYSDYEEEEEEGEVEDYEDEKVALNENNFKTKATNETNNNNRQEVPPTLPRKLEAPQPPLPQANDHVEEDSKRITKKRIAPQPDVRGNRTTTKSTTTAPLSTTSITQTSTFTSIINDADNNKTELLLGAAVLEMKFPKRNNLHTAEHCINIPKLTLTPSPSLGDIIVDNNNSQTQSKPSSEYGSPLEYPSSLIGSTETTPTPGRRQQKELRTPSYSSNGSQRRARSMVRDDDQYYSFDSDEENSYYSISSTGSSRYVVEI